MGILSQCLLNHLLALFILISFKQLLSLDLKAFHVSIEVKFETFCSASLRWSNDFTLVDELSSIFCTRVFSIDRSDSGDTRSGTILIPSVSESFACGGSRGSSAAIR